MKTTILGITSSADLSARACRVRAGSCRAGCAVPTLVHRLAGALPVLSITVKTCLLEPEPRSVRCAGEDEGHDGDAAIAHPRIRKSVRWLHREDLTLDPAAPALGVWIDKAVAGADLRPETFHHGALDERPLRDRVPIGERLPDEVDGMRILDFLNDRVSRCLDHLFPPFWSCRGAVEVATQPPQSLMPKLFVLVQPVVDLNEPIRAQHVTVGSPVAVTFDETRIEKDAQVLGYRRPRHVVAPGELVHRLRSRGQGVEQRASDRVGDGGEDVVRSRDRHW